jgi:hypothetical protein
MFGKKRMEVDSKEARRKPGFFIAESFLWMSR